MPTVSIVIPTFNEAQYLPRTLRCLAALEPPAAEIIVVGGGSVDETVAIAEGRPSAIAQSPNIKILNAPQAKQMRCANGYQVQPMQICELRELR